MLKGIECPEAAYHAALHCNLHYLGIGVATRRTEKPWPPTGERINHDPVAQVLFADVLWNSLVEVRVRIGMVFDFVTIGDHALDEVR